MPPKTYAAFDARNGEPHVRELLLPAGGVRVNVFTMSMPMTPGPATPAPTPDAPVFVLVHGIGMSHRYLERLQRHLSVTGTVHAVDLPGFGRSPTPASGVSIEQYAEYLGELLPRLSERPVVLVGHSLGAQFVTETAARFPELVSQLVLIGAVTDPTRDSLWRQALDLVRDTVKEPLSGMAIVIGDYLRCGPGWYLATVRPMLAYRTDLRLRHVSAPTLVIRGEDDPVSRRPWGARLAAQGPHGQLLELPGRHLVQFSAAEASAAGIRAFVGAWPVGARPAGASPAGASPATPAPLTEPAAG